MTTSLSDFMQCRKKWNKEFEDRRSKLVIKEESPESLTKELAQRSRAQSSLDALQTSKVVAIRPG